MKKLLRCLLFVVCCIIFNSCNDYYSFKIKVHYSSGVIDTIYVNSTSGINSKIQNLPYIKFHSGGFFDSNGSILVIEQSHYNKTIASNVNYFEVLERTLIKEKN